MPNTPVSPLTLSDRAQSKILSLMSQSATGKGPVRIYAERSELGTIEIALSFDEVRRHDVTLPAEGVTVVADTGTMDIASGGIIDYDTQGFVFSPGAVCDSPSIAK